MTNPTMEHTADTVHQVLVQNHEKLKMTLPRHMSADRFISNAMTLLRQQPALMTCSPESFFGALIQSAQLGLEPGVLALSYFLPFWNNKTHVREVQFIPGYKGLVQLASNSGKVAAVRAYPVHENDQFSYSLGLEPTIHHVPAQGNQGALSAFYAHVKLTNGEPLISVMTYGEVEVHRDRYSKAAKDGPWASNFTEMALKTCVRKALKLAPLSPELQTGLALDEMAETRQGQGLNVGTFDWAGLKKLDWASDTPTDAETTEAAVADAEVLLPNFGKWKNQSVRKPSNKTLVSYSNTVQKGIADAGKSRFKEQNKRVYAAIQAEMVRRVALEAKLPEDMLVRLERMEAHGIKLIEEIPWDNDDIVSALTAPCIPAGEEGEVSDENGNHQEAEV